MKKTFLIFGAFLTCLLALISLFCGVVVAGSLYYEKYYGWETLHQEYELLIFAGVLFFIPFIFICEYLEQ